MRLHNKKINVMTTKNSLDQGNKKIKNLNVYIEKTAFDSVG